MQAEHAHSAGTIYTAAGLTETWLESAHIDPTARLVQSRQDQPELHQ